jgi:sugar/nucleoside kinase (ribokinase family)
VTSQRKGIVAIGHVLIDGIGNATNKFLNRFGDLPSPTHVTPLFMEKFCKSLSQDSGLLYEGISWSLGGGVAIMAKAACALGLYAEVWASAGLDEHGKFLAREMSRAGIAAHFLPSDKPTGVFCSFGTLDGNKRIVVSQGAAMDLRGFKIPDEIFHPDCAFYIDGLLIDSPEWLAAQAGKAKANGMLVAMDLSTQGNAKANSFQLKKFAHSFCDIVFANKEEFQALGSLAGSETNNRTKWVVKKDRRGAALFHAGKWVEAATVAYEPVDDTGAGDVFSAGFMRAYLEGFDDLRCLRCANAVAARAIRYRGSAFDARDLQQAFEDERRI